MDLGIISDLNWHVHEPTLLSFIKQFFAIDPTTSTWSNTFRKTLIYKSDKCAELTMGDYCLVPQKPSAVAFAIVYNSLKIISSHLTNLTQYTVLVSYHQ